MTTGIKAARKIQMGVESTQGTAVTPTTYWRGTGTIQDNREQVFPTEDIGILTGTDRSYFTRYEAQLSLDSTEATYQQLPYLFEMGIEHAAASTDANGSSFVYDFACASSDMTESTDMKTYTFVGGDNTEVEKFAFGFAKSISLSGEAGGALMMSAEIIGRQVSTGDWAAVSVPSVEEILFSKGKFYIDNVAAMPIAAPTQITNTLISADISINTGWQEVYTADGSLFFSFIKPTTPEVTLTVTMEYNSSAVAEIAAWRAGTARVITLKFEGATAATNYLSIQMAGKWDNFEKIGERDGNDIVTGTFRARYNSTAGKMCYIVVHNDDADGVLQ